MAIKMCCILLLYLLCLVNKSSKQEFDCSYIDGQKSAVQINCSNNFGAESNSNKTIQNGCHYDLYQSDASQSNRANVRLLRIQNQTCDAISNLHEKNFTAIQEFEYTFTSSRLSYFRSDSQLISHVISTNKNLEKLNVFHDQLERIQRRWFDGTTSWKQLDISYNALQQLEFEFEYLSFSEHNSMILNCSHNQIKHISPGTFKFFKSLEIFDISDNNIAKLDNNLFRNTANLRILRLQGNPFNLVKSKFGTQLHRMFAGI